MDEKSFFSQCGSAPARAMETSSLSAHVGLVSADIGAIFHFERLANPLELDVAPSMVALANMC